MNEIFQAIILGLVEGLTEFLPVSSTGHLILAGHAIGFEGQRASTFEVFIQLGAILSILFLYRDRFIGLFKRDKEGFYGTKAAALLIITTIPAVITGLLAHGFIKRYLFSPSTVIGGLFIGGLWMIVTEYALKNRGYRIIGIDNLSLDKAFIIGLFQCLALWPGMSRSASTILGGMYSGIDRKTSAEYSFIAAVPIMFAATLFDLYKGLPFLSIHDIPLFGTGFIVSFISALLAVRTFIYILGRYDLRVFGWYRVIFSILLFYLLL
jgi:undecaprenyl-diphosphatase